MFRSNDARQPRNQNIRFADQSGTRRFALFSSCPREKPPIEPELDFKRNTVEFAEFHAPFVPVESDTFQQANSHGTVRGEGFFGRRVLVCERLSRNGQRRAQTKHHEQDFGESQATVEEIEYR